MALDSSVRQRFDWRAGSRTNEAGACAIHVADPNGKGMDRQVIEDARHGSRAAFEALAAAVMDRLYGMAVLVLHDRALAEDAVQETLIQAWRDLPRLRDADRFEGWLHGVLVHRCLDLVRRRRPTVRELPDSVSDGFNVEAMVGNRDVVRRGMARLKPAERAALVLRYYLDLTVPQMAEVLHVPLGTAKSRLHAAEAAIRAAIDLDSAMVVEGGLA